MQPFPCAGIIVFGGCVAGGKVLPTGIQTILARTERNNYSFPKGKRNKGETDIVAAWRELQEETGLTQNNVRLLEGVHFDELTGKGNPSVRYFVGALIDDTQRKLTFDSSELAGVEWHSIGDALQLEGLREARRSILGQAYNIYIEE